MGKREKKRLALLRKITKKPLDRFSILENDEIKEAIETTLECKLDTNLELDEFSKVGQAWNTFSHLMKKIKDGGTFGDGTLKSGHICIVLKGIGFALYFYEIVDEYKEEHLEVFEHIRLILDKILMCNQNASYALKSYLSKYEQWRGRLFPVFFEHIKKEKIIGWSDQIDDEIEIMSNTKYIFREVDRKKYWEQLIRGKHINIKKCYAELLSILNTIKPDLPRENIAMIEELILRCEHGYYLGFLLERTFEEYRKKYPEFNPRRRSERWKREKLHTFRKGREERVYKTSVLTFGETDELKEKLRKMFVIKEIE